MEKGRRKSFPLRIVRRRDQQLRQMKLKLAAAHRRMIEESTRRRAIQEALRSSEQHYISSLKQSRRLQEQLRQLSHQLLSVQEEERKRISRELHDEIVQTLTAIQLRLANLNRDAQGYSRKLERGVGRTQRLVEAAVDIVHRFARDLRPRMLDDLGLIPAMHAFLKDFAQPTGLRIDFIACSPEILDELSSAKRAVLYRVAQEALTNIARHAQAHWVTVQLHKHGGAIEMEITDDGQGFAVERVWSGQPDKRLGLLGMRERIQMVGGQFEIDSSPQQGTTVHAEIPIGDGNIKLSKLVSSLDQEPANL